MKYFSALTLLICFNSVIAFAQFKQKKTSTFNVFNRTSISYGLGINQSFNNNTINALLLKTVVGIALPQAGFGIGIENGTYNGSENVRFNTLAFTGNLHLLAKPLSYNGINYFAKGGAGYAARVFNEYNKGFTYEGATGIILTNKKGGKYFLQAIYHHQEINGFALSAGNKLKIETLGLGIGVWL
jgi:hypothetical protein